MNIDFARQQMVEQQVRAWDVFDDGILDVLGTVPRERFVPDKFRSLAFADTQIPLGRGQHMMTPTVEGRLLQALDLNGNDSVLEIGTGSGFLTACLSRLAGRVTSVDIYEDFVTTAGDRLAENGYDNVELMTLDAMAELPAGEFDAIALTGSLWSFDPRFVMALRPGGRLFVVVGDGPVMEAKLVTRTGDSDWRTESLFETRLTPLVNAAPPPQFAF